MVTWCMHHHMFQEKIVDPVPGRFKHFFFKHRPYIVSKRKLHFVPEYLLHKTPSLHITCKDNRRFEILAEAWLWVCHGHHLRYGGDFRDVPPVSSPCDQHHIRPCPFDGIDLFKYAAGVVQGDHI